MENHTKTINVSIYKYKPSKKNIKKEISFKISTKTIKYLRINLIKRWETFITENDKTLIKEI